MVVKGKRGIALESVGWWIIGFIVLFIILGAIILIKNWGYGLIDYFKNLLRFGR